MAWILLVESARRRAPPRKFLESIVMRRSFKSILVATAFAAGVSAAHADQIISLKSGNGIVGLTDNAVTFLQGPADTDFATTFTATDFANARAGAAASIIVNHPAWITSSAFNSDPSTPNNGAQWISNVSTGATEGSSALYAIDFTITDAFISAATIDFDFAVDNLLGNFGATTNQGLYLNGTALSGSTVGGSFGTVYNFTRSDIAPLLVTGTNTLYINSTDVGGPGGLIFSATITTEGGSVPVPEPGIAALFGLGLLGLGLARRRNVRRA
jgi:hypothetical protein